MKPGIGNDLRKWYITKRLGKWYICPPGFELIDESARGQTFPTGRQAIERFARGRS